MIVQPGAYVFGNSPGVPLTGRVDEQDGFRDTSASNSVTTTDPDARAKFRLYWAFLSPGVVLIRRAALGMVKKEAERMASRTRPTPSLI